MSPDMDELGKDRELVVECRDMIAEVWRASLEPSSAAVTVGDAARPLLLDAALAVSCGLGDWSDDAPDDVVVSSAQKDTSVVSNAPARTELPVGMKAKLTAELAVSPAIARLEATADAVSVLPPSKIVVTATAV